MTFDQLFTDHNLTPEEREAMIIHLAALRTAKLLRTLLPTSTPLGTQHPVLTPHHETTTGPDLPEEIRITPIRNSLLPTDHDQQLAFREWLVDSYSAHPGRATISLKFTKTPAGPVYAHPEVQKLWERWQLFYRSIGHEC